MKLLLSLFLFIVLCLILLIPYYNNVKAFVKDVISFFTGIKPWLRRNKIKNGVEDNCKDTIEELNQLTPELNLPELSLHC